MRVKNVIYEDLVNYKKPSMMVGTISCGGKCCHEAGIPITVCQNDALRKSPVIDITDEVLIERYLGNHLTRAIVFGGLEPLEQFSEIMRFIGTLRSTYHCDDDVVLYTGYTKEEVNRELDDLRRFPNIIVKFGRYIPNHPSVFDETLGVTLASDNQYAEKLT